MKWKNEPGSATAASGNLRACVARGAVGPWQLLITRDWFNPVVMEDRSKLLVHGFFKTKAKAKAAGEALVDIIRGGL